MCVQYVVAQMSIGIEQALVILVIVVAVVVLLRAVRS